MDRATIHAQRVLDGYYPERIGNLHILACQRHLHDLERQNTKEFPYYWDAASSERIIDYAETLTLIEGMEPRPLTLLPCQAFDEGAVMGWKKSGTGNRRFRRRYLCKARQNGKTMENGITGSYIAGFSGYHYGKLFTVATHQKQARLAWEEIAKFVQSDEDLRVKFIVKDYISLITALETQCTIEALSKDRSLDEGFRSIFASIDEIHQHKDNSIYKAIYNGTRGLTETLVSMITTRGKSVSSFCKEMDDYAIGILRGNFTAEDFFVDIYTLDQEDDIWDPENWIKANPYLAKTTQGMETLMTDAQTAKDMGGSDLRDFITKGLNLWMPYDEDIFIDPEKWYKCGSHTKLEAFRGCSCYVGLDLSSGGDLTTLSLEFPKDNGGIYLYSHSFMPRGRVEEHIQTDLAPYDLWVQKELITVTGGICDFKNDYKFIIKHLSELQEEYDLNFLGIGYDQHNADGFLADLESFGCPLLMITQSARFLSDGTVDMQLLVKSEKVEYDQENELLTWSFLNAKVVKNSFGESKIDKEPKARHKRIDPADACIDSHVIHVKNVNDEKMDAAKAMQEYLKIMGWEKRKDEEK